MIMIKNVQRNMIIMRAKPALKLHVAAEQSERAGFLLTEDKEIGRKILFH